MTEADTVSRKIDELKKLQSWLGAGSPIHCSRRSNAVKFETYQGKRPGVALLFDHDVRATALPSRDRLQMSAIVSPNSSSD
jgi:hypothetical protein